MVAGRDWWYPVVTISLYVEGGGNSKELTTLCRRAFRRLIERAGLRGTMPRIVACGGRQNAYERFATALKNDHRVPILLVDAEGPLTGAGPWEHLRQQDGWRRPNGATVDHCHLMVQVMESWFLADKRALKLFYGPEFRERSLPGNPDVEEVAKNDILAGLAQATRSTRKGSYARHKGSHSFMILGEISPSAVEGAAPHAKRLLDTLRAGGPA